MKLFFPVRYYQIFKLQKMIGDEKCAVCSDSFTQTNLAWIISFCGHNICNKCLKNALSTKTKHINCTECKQKYEVDKETLEQFPKDITILKKLKDSKNTSTIISDTNDKKQQQIMPGGLESSLLLSNASIRSITNCPKHGKPLQIICTIDRGLLCAHCAIFGDHHNHAFKTIEQFENELAQLKQTYKQIQFKKQICEEGIRGKKYRSSIIAKISDKKDKLVVQIKDRFSKLISLIKDAESKVFDELVKCFRATDSQISKVTKQQNMVQKYFYDWKKQTFDYIKGIEDAFDLKDKINVFYRRNKPNLLDGKKILKQIQQNNQSIRAAIEDKISSIRIQYTPSFEGYIYNYARVAINPNQLKAKNVIDFSPSAEIQEIRPMKKQMKIQFIRSDQLPQVIKQQVFVIPKKQQMSKTGRAALAASGLNKVKSNPKLPKAILQKIDTPKKPLTPPKHLRKQDQADLKRQQNLDFAERMLHEFIKSTDTLDITGCDLNDDQVLHIVSEAAAQKPIKCIKLCKNKLTNIGLNNIIEHLHNVTNINLSYNLLTDESIDIFITNRQFLPCLRIINLSHNKLTERKIKSKIEQLKRVGIITTL